MDQQKAFKEFIEKNISLIFTVDCGTLSFKAIEFAAQKIDVIVLITINLR